MATNNFLPFTPTDTGTNLLTQVEYAGATDRTVGNQPGIASSKLNNKAIRQANVIASQLAQYVADKTGLNMLDDGNLSNLLANLVVAFAPTTQEYDITNLTFTTSVSASALTIAVKTKAGTNASATDPITVGMRSTTLTSGDYFTRTLTGALSLVISSGSTLGQTSAVPAYIYVYLIDNAGTLELAVSGTYYAQDALVSTTAEGGAGGADSATVIYSTTARTNVACRLIGYILNTQGTAGTWASAGSQLQLLPVDRPTSGSVVQVRSTTKTDTFTTTSSSYTDVTGMSVSITPRSILNKIFVTVSLQGSQDVGVERASFQLVRGSTPICIGDQVGSRTQASAEFASFNADLGTSLSINYVDSPASTSSTTYKVQGKTSSGGGNLFVNRTDNDADVATTVRYASTITVIEIQG